MKIENSQYLKFVIFHLLIGLAVFLVTPLSKLYAIAILLVVCRYVIFLEQAYLQKNLGKQLHNKILSQYSENAALSNYIQ